MLTNNQTSCSLQGFINKSITLHFALLHFSTYNYQTDCDVKIIEFQIRKLAIDNKSQLIEEFRIEIFQVQHLQINPLFGLVAISKFSLEMVKLFSFVLFWHLIIEFSSVQQDETWGYNSKYLLQNNLLLIGTYYQWCFISDGNFSIQIWHFKLP